MQSVLEPRIRAEGAQERLLERIVGAVAAVQLANLAGSVRFFTALGSDELGRRTLAQLVEQGVTVHAATPPAAHRRALTYLDGDGERTITVFGEKLLPGGGDGSLPWEE